MSAARRTEAVNQYVALLRGVNVGTANRVAMADLRAVFERLGFGHVRTLLNSGNVVFSASAKRDEDLAARIEKALARILKLSSSVAVLSGDEVAFAVERNPLARIAKNPSWLLIVVPKDASALIRLKPLLKQQWGREAFALGSRVAYLWCADGLAKSPLWTAVDRALDRTATARNVLTMTKLKTVVEDQASR